MERPAFRVSGFVAVAGLLALAAAGLVVVLATAGGSEAATAVSVTAVATVFALVAAVLATGFTIVNRNDAQVVQFYGRYVGTIRVAASRRAPS